MTSAADGAGGDPSRFGVRGRAATGALVAALLCVLSARAAPPPGTAAQAAGEPAEAFRLLDRMGTALRTLDYEGILVYLLDNRLETLHLVHRVEGGQIQERLIALSGPVRAVARSRDHVTCTLADGRPISVKSHSGQRLLRAQHIVPGDLTGRYRIELAGAERIAGRDTDIVAILPQDALRYGYRFYLDRATGLPLKSDLIDLNGNALEQILFASVTLDGAEPRAPAPEAGGADAVETDSAAARSSWRFETLPAGFEQTMHDTLIAPDGTPVEHFLFSDRLSSYSVYIESGAQDGLQGVTRVGAAHAAGRRVESHQVTAVGEVPAATVEAALDGLRRAPLADAPPAQPPAQPPRTGNP